MATIVSDTTRSDSMRGERRALPPLPRRVWPRGLAILLAGLAVGGLVSVGTGAGAAPRDISIDEAEAQKKRLRERQAEMAIHMDGAKATIEELVAALTTLDQQVQAQTAKSAEAERAWRDADRRFQEFDRQMGENQLEVDRINNELRQQAVRRYTNPEEDDSSVRLLKANDFDEAQQRKVLSETVAANSKALIEQLRGARGKLDGLHQQAADARAEADARKAEQNELTRQVLTEREAQARLQAEWDTRLKSLQHGDDELDAQVAGLDQAIAQQRARLGGAAPLPPSSGGFVMPVNGRNGDGYGAGRNHPGVDILAPVGTPIFAAQSGRIVQASANGAYNGGYGNLVVIDHAGGLQTRYAHLSTVRVSVGQVVSQGQQIGNVGMTGRTSGAHLHFEVYLNGVRQNPMNYL
jgi:murein DD-endopeptidase MepM/ murein hydrolase activator NlpD